jgi:hypothetical protein
MWPPETVTRFDAFLEARGLELDAVVVGGAALALLGIVSRRTRDFDVMYPPLSAEIVEAARAFAHAVRTEGDVLADDWLNNGPSSLADDLPTGWLERTQLVFAGRAVTLRTLGRLDLLRSKLFALCDRGTDLGDCLALRPTAAELDEIALWLERQDTHPDWPAHARVTLSDLGRRLGHGGHRGQVGHGV